MENPSCKKKVFYSFGFILFLYLFLLSLQIIKYSFSEIGPGFITLTLKNINELNAFGIGWLLTLIMQSSAAATSALAAMNYAGIIGPIVLIFMVIGTRIGTTITALFTSLLVSAKRRDFRHGFEIGLANIVYALPVAILMFLLEYFLSLFSVAGNYFITLGIPFKLGFVDKITIPVIEFIGIFLPNYLFVIFGILLLIFSLKNIPKFMIGLWGEENLRKKINKYMNKKHLSFLIGFLIALVLTSTSITITLLVPLVVSRIINLRKVIPYIIGTNLGGVIDAIIGGLIIGKTALPAIFAYISFSIIGLLWLFNTDLLFKITKYVSKKTLHISRKRAIFFVLLFIMIAIILSFI